jgi:hypothetical protein
VCGGIGLLEQFDSGTKRAKFCQDQEAVRTVPLLPGKLFVEFSGDFMLESLLGQTLPGVDSRYHRKESYKTEASARPRRICAAVDFSTDR